MSAKPEQIVRHLLEAGEEDYDPKDLLRRGAEAKHEDLVARFPEELQDAVQYAPNEFLEALGKRTKSESWDFSGGEISEWWPVYDDDLDPPWYKLGFYTQLDIMGGTLHIGVWSCDTDGDHDMADGDIYSWESHQNLRMRYSYKTWLQAMIDYEDWVSTEGRDPLDFFNVRESEKTKMTWTFEAEREGDGLTFLQARCKGRVILRPERLPAAACDYLNLPQNDPASRRMDYLWDDLVSIQSPEVVIDGDHLTVTTELETERGTTASRAKAYKARLAQAADKSAEDHRKELLTADADYSSVVP